MTFAVEMVNWPTAPTNLHSAGSPLLRKDSKALTRFARWKRTPDANHPSRKSVATGFCQKSLCLATLSWMSKFTWRLADSTLAEVSIRRHQYAGQWPNTLGNVPKWAYAYRTGGRTIFAVSAWKLISSWKLVIRVLSTATNNISAYECPPGMYFDQCGPKCPKSCKDITPNAWAPSSMEGKDIMPDLADWSLQQTMQELADVCDTTPVDGCFCTGGNVLKDGKCVDPVLCGLSKKLVFETSSCTFYTHNPTNTML